MGTNIFEGAEIIHSYSRAQAIEDGVLVDLSALAPEVCGQFYKFPIACTAAVWGVIDSAIKNEKYNNDLNGVIHDLLFMSIKMCKELDPTTRRFAVIINGADHPHNKPYAFNAVCGPGDDAEPVITIMFPGED
jgi:hypothetical protein